VKAIGLKPAPRFHDLRHCGKSNAMRSGVHSVIAGMTVGHGNRKQDLKSPYICLSDADLSDAIDRMKFGKGETEIWLTERGNGKLGR
jgi:hypothetical protein